MKKVYLVLILALFNLTLLGQEAKKIILNLGILIGE